MKFRKSFAFLPLVLTALAFTTTGCKAVTEPISKTAISSACQQDGNSKGYCNCFAAYLVDHYSVAQLAELDFNDEVLQLRVAWACRDYVLDYESLLDESDWGLVDECDLPGMEDAWGC